MDKNTRKQRQHELAVAWQDHGDQKALLALLGSVEGLSLTVCKRFTRRGDDQMWEEIAAECRLAAVEASSAYDRTRGGYAALAYLMMLGRARATLKRHISPVTAHSKIPPSAAGLGVPLLADHEEGVPGVVLEAPEHDRGAADGMAALEALFDAAGLDGRDRHVVLSHMREGGARLCAQEFGVTVSRVGQIYREAAAKIRAAAEQRGMTLQDLL